MWVAVHRQGLYTRYFGLFESKEDAWKWINQKDMFRQQEWWTLYIEDKNTEDLF
jgi:hypothetical protein